MCAGLILSPHEYRGDCSEVWSRDPTKGRATCVRRAAPALGGYDFGDLSSPCGLSLTVQFGQLPVSKLIPQVFKQYVIIPTDAIKTEYLSSNTKLYVFILRDNSPNT